MKVNIEVTAGPARGKVFCIDQADLFIVGRARDSKISLPNDPYLSRQHFVLEIAPPNCRITDLGSKNGTFVNGIRYGGRKPDPSIRQAPNGAMSALIHTGEIVVGDTRMSVHIESRIPETARPAGTGSSSGTPRKVNQYPSNPAVPISIAEGPSPAGDSSLGFLIPRVGQDHLRSTPIPGAPSPIQGPLHGVNAGAQNVYAVPAFGDLPRSDAELKRRKATPLPNELQKARDSRNAPLFSKPPHEADRVAHDAPTPGHGGTLDRHRPVTGENTILESASPGVDADRTVMESIAPDATPSPDGPQQDSDEPMICTLCGLDVSNEVRSRGRIAGAEYVCHTCRAGRAFAAKERMARKAIVPRNSPTDPQFPALRGMDLNKYSSLNYPGYSVIDVLGSGGMGVVYKAMRQSDGVMVAIKSLLPNVPVSFENYRIFHREIEITRKLRHPNIVEVLDHGRVKGAYFCVLEYVDGLSLKDYLVQMNGKLTLKQASPLMLDVLSGLSAAHNATIETRASGPVMQSGIVHRDLKPENILLKRDAFGWTPKIADFGIAKSFESAGMTDMTIAGVCGTPTYWPREQLTHYRYLHPATDVFSIAAVFYEMLSGKCARPGMQETLVQCHRRAVSPELADFMRVIGNNPILPIKEVVPSIPTAVAAVLDKALLECEVPLDEVEMRDTLQNLRYPDAGAFRAALTSALKLSSIGV